MKQLAVAVLTGFMIAGCGSGGNQQGGNDKEKVSQDCSRIIVDTMATRGDTATKDKTKVDSMR
ncbi:MAG: hypothetical protein JWN76_3100 [Chitinophagaceae bacterium]|nr:hypothetical protein [Chitinophagaceae bacterium]